MKKYKKVPVILQMENVECGAASLAMILAYNKKYVPLEKLRIDCGVSRDGSNLKNILIAAKKYGLNPKPYKMNVQGVMNNAKFPTIIHWNFNHFVVLTGFDNKNRAIINDPAQGTVKVEFEEFKKSFTGIIVSFEKTEDFEEGGTSNSVYNFLKVRLKNSNNLIVYILLVGLVLSLIGIVMPLFSRIFFDYILFKKSPGWINSLLMMMGITAIIVFSLEYLQAYFILKLQGKFSITASSLFMWHVLRLPMDFFSARYTGDTSEKQKSNDEIAEIICKRILPVFLDVIMIGIYVVILFYFDFKIAIIGLLVGGTNILLAVFSTDENNTRNLVRDDGKFNGVAISGIEMIETIKATGAESGYFEKLLGYVTKYNNTEYKINKRNIQINVISEILRSLLNIFVLILGVYNILNGKFTVGILLAVQGFMILFLQPISNLLPLSSAIKETKGQAERVEDVMKYKAEDQIDLNEEIVDYEKLSGKISIKHLQFSYNPLVSSLIQDFNLEIKRGEMIALVGSSGSGKSTIAKLIAGLHTPQGGDILFDDKPKNEHNRIIFSHSLATIDQNYTIFNDTIMNNITLWDNLISGQSVINACKDAMIHDDIVRRDNGYENILSFTGKNLSGGQCQRIDIARALVLDPTILILDEATSALDPTTEKIIMDNIKKRGITIIIIAHRLSTIRDCDNILYLNKGVIVEKGTHDELMKENGLYAKSVLNK